MFFPNGQRMIEVFVVRAGDLLGSVIINNKITISGMPAVQIPALLLEHDDFLSNLKNNYKII